MRDACACAKVNWIHAAERQEWRSRRFERWQRGEAQRGAFLSALFEVRPWTALAKAYRLDEMNDRHTATAKRWGML